MNANEFRSKEGKLKVEGWNNGSQTSKVERRKSGRRIYHEVHEGTRRRKRQHLDLYQGAHGENRGWTLKVQGWKLNVKKRDSAAEENKQEFQQKGAKNKKGLKVETREVECRKSKVRGQEAGIRD